VLADYARDYDGGGDAAADGGEAAGAADADARRRAATLRGWAGALGALAGEASEGG